MILPERVVAPTSLAFSIQKDRICFVKIADVVYLQPAPTWDNSWMTRNFVSQAIEAYMMVGSIGETRNEEESIGAVRFEETST